MEWRCEHCGAETGPEAVYCVTCGERRKEEPDADAASLKITAARSGGESRSTLVGSSTGVAPSLLERRADHALMQPLPRKVRLGGAGWTALVGGWPELCLCLGTLPLVAVGVYAGGMLLGGAASAVIGAVGVILFVVLAFLYGAPDTARTMRGYRLARYGWAAGGEIVRKSSRKGRFGASYRVEYSYTDSRGVIRHGQQEVTREQWQALQAHDPITVLYDPEHPHISTIYELLGLVAVGPPAAALPAAEVAADTVTEDGGRRTEE